MLTKKLNLGCDFFGNPITATCQVVNVLKELEKYPKIPNYKEMIKACEHYKIIGIKLPNGIVLVNTKEELYLFGDCYIGHTCHKCATTNYPGIRTMREKYGKNVAPGNIVKYKGWWYQLNTIITDSIEPEEYLLRRVARILCRCSFCRKHSKILIYGTNVAVKQYMKKYRRKLER